MVAGDEDDVGGGHVRELGPAPLLGQPGEPGNQAVDAREEPATRRMPGIYFDHSSVGQSTEAFRYLNRIRKSPYFGSPEAGFADTADVT